MECVLCPQIARDLLVATRGRRLDDLRAALARDMAHARTRRGTECAGILYVENGQRWRRVAGEAVSCYVPLPHVATGTQGGAATLLALCATPPEFPAGLRLLLEYGVDPDECMEDGATALYEAAQSGSLSCMTELLKHDVDVNKSVHSGLAKGATPLCPAVQGKHVDCAKLLLDAGASMQCSFRGATPIVIAGACDSAEVVDLLVHTASARGEACPLDRAVIAAASRGSLAAMRALVRHGASLNCTEVVEDADGRSTFTPLMCAASHGDANLVRWMLGSDLHVGGPGTQEWTAAFVSMERNRPALTHVLLAVATDGDQWSMVPSAPEGAGGAGPRGLEFTVDATARTLVPVTDGMRARRKRMTTVVRLPFEPLRWRVIIRALVRCDDWKRRRTLLFLRLLRDSGRNRALGGVVAQRRTHSGAPRVGPPANVPPEPSSTQVGAGGNTGPTRHGRRRRRRTSGPT